MRTIAQAQGEWARATARGSNDAFAFGAPVRRPMFPPQEPFDHAGEPFSERPADLPPVWLAVARLSVFLGALSLVASIGAYLVVHALVGSLGGFLGHTP